MHQVTLVGVISTLTYSGYAYLFDKGYGNVKYALRGMFENGGNFKLIGGMIGARH